MLTLKEFNDFTLEMNAFTRQIKALRELAEKHQRAADIYKVYSRLIDDEMDASFSNFSMFITKWNQSRDLTPEEEAKEFLRGFGLKRVSKQ